jgi:two-component system alkaline phosphatase synthesis response regulator PhoP
VTGARKAVWLVDDEPDVRTYLAVALEDEGLRVRTFDGAEGFLEEALRTPPDLVCLDIMMPNRSGLSLYKDLRTAPTLRRIPVLIVSGYSRSDEFLGGEFRRLVDDARIPEPDGFVEKPVALADLLDRVRRLLAREEP